MNPIDLENCDILMRNVKNSFLGPVKADPAISYISNLERRFSDRFSLSCIDDDPELADIMILLKTKKSRTFEDWLYGLEQ